MWQRQDKTAVKKTRLKTSVFLFGFVHGGVILYSLDDFYAENIPCR